MQISIEKRRIKKKWLKCGRKILTHALDGYYFFLDDEIEDIIDKGELLYMKRGRQAVRSFIWSHDKIRAKICDLGFTMYGNKI